MNVYGFRYNERVAMKTLPVVRQRGVCCGLPDVDEKWAEDTSTLMKALADPTRLTMVASLWKAKTPICICDFTADLDLVPDAAHRVYVLPDGVVALPVFISLAWIDRASGAAAHRYHHICRAHEFVCERLWKLAADVQADLTHRLDHPRIERAGRFAA